MKFDVNDEPVDPRGCAMNDDENDGERLEQWARGIEERIERERQMLPSGDPRRDFDYWWEVMCDYCAPPLWRRGSFGPSPLPPEGLRLSASLCRAIWEWEEDWRIGSRGSTEDEFVNKGWVLAQQIANETQRPVEYDDRVAFPVSGGHARSDLT